MLRLSVAFMGTSRRPLYILTDDDGADQFRSSDLQETFDWLDDNAHEAICIKTTTRLLEISLSVWPF